MSGKKSKKDSVDSPVSFGGSQSGAFSALVLMRAMPCGKGWTHSARERERRLEG